MKFLDFAGFSVGVADDADGFAGAFASASVGLRALATDWEAATVADAPVAINSLEALEVLLDFAAEVTFDEDAVGVDGLDDFVELFGGKVFCADIGVDAGVFEDLFHVAGSDAVDVREGGFDAFVARDVNTEYTRHRRKGDLD